MLTIAKRESRVWEMLGEHKHFPFAWKTHHKMNCWMSVWNTTIQWFTVKVYGLLFLCVFCLFLLNKCKRNKLIRNSVRAVLSRCCCCCRFKMIYKFWMFDLVFGWIAFNARQVFRLFNRALHTKWKYGSFGSVTKRKNLIPFQWKLDHESSENLTLRMQNISLSSTITKDIYTAAARNLFAKIENRETFSSPKIAHRTSQIK